MKTSLKFIALVIAAGYPVAVFAQLAGAHLPSAFNAQNVTGLFTAVFIGLLLLKDYSGSRLSLTRPCAVIVPPVDAFSRRSDRLAA